MPPVPNDIADRVGFDYVECEGCDLTFPVEETVRMLRFNGRHGRFRVCKMCAGVEPRNEHKLLALRLAQGKITQEQYFREVERLHDG